MRSFRLWVSRESDLTDIEILLTHERKLFALGERVRLLQ